MAYDKHTWTCDEPITVERLNHIEDGIANAGGDCGFECEDGWVTLTEESVTTAEVESGSGIYVGDLSYSQLIDADAIRVTFNGTEYICSNVTEEDGGLYGAADGWSTYPFLLESDSNPYGASTSLETEVAGTYTVKIEVAGGTVVTTTPCFDKARGYWCEDEIVTLTEESVTTEQSGPFVWGSLSYSQLIDAETLKVTFNGTEYECPRNDTPAGAIYGGMNPTTMTPDFSQYPFAILSAEQIGNRLITETAGTYAVKVQAVETTVTTTPCFDKARGYSCENVTLTEETLTATRVIVQ